MYEFELYNKEQDITRIVYGHSIKDLLCRHPEYDNGKWKVIYSEYID